MNIYWDLGATGLSPFVRLLNPSTLAEAFGVGFLGTNVEVLGAASDIYSFALGGSVPQTTYVAWYAAGDQYGFVRISDNVGPFWVVEHPPVLYSLQELANVRQIPGTGEDESAEAKLTKAATQALPKPFLQNRVPEALTTNVGTRANGTVGDRVIKLAPGERRICQWRYRDRLAKGDTVHTMALPVSDDPSKVVVVGEVEGEKRYGVEGQNAKVQLEIVDNEENIGQRVLVHTTVTPEGDDADRAVMQIEIIKESAGYT